LPRAARHALETQECNGATTGAQHFSYNGFIGFLSHLFKGTWVKGLVRVATVAIVISAVSVMYHYWIPANNTTIALTLLLLVLASAAAWGLPAAIFASVWSMLCLNYYFLPPVHSMGIDDPQNWVAWGVYLITALVASDLSTRSKKRALEATRKQREIERMYALSCRLMLDDTAAELAKHIPRHVAEVFGAKGVSFFDRVSGQIHRIGTEACRDEDLIRCASGSELWAETAPGTMLVPVNLGANTIGSLAFHESGASPASMQSIGNLVAMAMDRARKQEVAGTAEAARRHQELKSMLLDALAHEFQTPLTSIRAAIGAMLADAPAGDQHEWLEIMGQESARLSSMMAEAIQMARIEAGHVDLDMQTHTIDDLVHSALEQETAEPSQIRVEVPEGLQPVSADAGLIRLVIRQIVGNALKYSYPGTPITVRAEAGEDHVVVSVADCGPGIPEEEQELIFQRYYRGRQGRSLTGMGMGLPIVRQVVEAHEGRVWVESRPGAGAKFSFTLPFAHEEANV
jgi:two-component system, OmpR family, sensor histidine kinase KdpD